MNVKRLLKIKEQILKEPENYNQDYLHVIHDCGTAHCIAGWAVTLFGANSGNRVVLNAFSILDLSDYEESVKLFGYMEGNGTNCWPEKFKKAYKEAKTAKGRARVAARRIDHFIKTNGEE